MRRAVPMTVIIVTMSAMAVRLLRSGTAILASEGHVHQPEHIEGGDERGNNAKQPIHPVRFEGSPENFVLGPETSKRWNARDGKRGNSHRHKCPGHVNPQAAHLAHVLLAADTMNDGAGRQKQQSFEERMRHQVKDAGGKGAYAASHEHVAELRDGRVCEHLLYVRLCDADGCSK